mgnify:CR=1 FL=1
MDNNPQDKRRQAARKFVNALDDLETVFQSTSAEPSEPSSAAAPPKASSAPSLEGDEEADLGQLLDDAVQDIERFMSSEDPPSS